MRMRCDARMVWWIREVLWMAATPVVPSGSKTRSVLTQARGRPRCIHALITCTTPVSIGPRARGLDELGPEVLSFLGIGWQLTGAKEACSTRPRTQDSNNAHARAVSGPGRRDVGAVVGATAAVFLGGRDARRRCPKSDPWTPARAAHEGGHGSARAPAASVPAAHGR